MYIKIVIVKIVLGFTCFSAYSQIRVSGFVRDSTSREVLVGAHIIDGISKKGVTTDNTGFFSISVKPESRITVSFVGYNVVEFAARLAGGTLAQILLSPANSIDEVVITHAKRQTHSVATLSSIELQQIPSLGAKPDVMKAIQLLPGVQSQNEGSSTILVRGGNPGENLYLFDNVALIYVNHLGGFTSVFNPDIINIINVYKGGFPSKYGGKLSSIVDIAQREGNVNATKGAYSIGITDASFFAEGPTSIQNTTFIVTGRKTLIDPIMALASKLSGGGDYILSYGFHDFNGKFTWRPNTKNTFSVNLYQGDDYLNFWYSNRNNSGREKARLSNAWGNWLLSTKWNRVHNSSLYSTQSLSFVRYRLKNAQSYYNTDPSEKIEFKRDYRSSVQDISYKWDFKADLFRNWSLDYGLQSSYLRFNPNRIYISNNSSVKSEDPINTFETALYAENRLELLKTLQLRIGARAVNYVTAGFSDFRIEPRTNIDIKVGSNHTLNLSYMETNQFSHLLFTQGEIMSNEVWVPADKDINPASSRQISGGWRGSFRNGMFDGEVSGYYKTLTNIATYREGYSSLMGDGLWRNKVEAGGEGVAYGVEFFLRKTIGNWTGFAGYTWSKATRRYDNINNGKVFTFEFDRPHSISLNLNRKLNEKLTLSTSWVFQSGLPFTPVIGRQLIPSITGLDNEPYYYEAFIYGEKNSERMRFYHRLDVALHYSTFTKNGNRAQWTFALYNAYNRKNPYSYLYTHDASEQTTLVPNPFWNNLESFTLYQVSFFPILPTVSYKVYFDDFKLYKAQKAKRRAEEKDKKKKSNWLYFDE
jgi:hypothetical protein